MSYRLAIAVALFGASALLLSAQRVLPAAAGDKNTENNLRNQVSQLQQQVQQQQNTQKTLQSTIDGYRGAGLIHVVLLTAKPGDAKPDTADSKSKSDPKADEKAETRKTIDEAYSQLAKIKGVRGLWAGKPSAKGTPEANADYSIALVVVFDDAAGLKTYLNDSAHTKFADKHLKYYETPIVFDFEPRKPQP